MNGVRAELQIKRSVPEKLWNAKKGCAFARDKRAQELNQYLEFIRTRVYQIHRELSEAGKPVSAEIIKLRLNGETDTPKTLLEIFREHNQKYRDLMGREFAKGTVLRYERTVTYLEEFLQAKYNLNDIPIKNVTNSFVLEFEHYVKITKNCAQNAAIKYLKNLKKITRMALANKWLDEDPFYGIRFHQTQTNRDFLTEEELNTIINRNFGIPRLEIVRDIFVFCSLTGLAFTDVKHLTPDHISYTPDSGYWIKKAREKTNNLCNVPLLEIP